MEVYTEVFAWGLDHKGQLGLGEKPISKSYPSPRFCSYNILIKDISCGEDHSGFISDLGHVYCMGSNLNGKLGIGDRSVKTSPSPCLVEALAGYISEKISCGYGHTGVITNEGLVFTWGTGEFGALGTGNTENQWLPTEVFANSQKISCGARHTGIIAFSHKLFMCGSGDAGQLGTGKRHSLLDLTEISTSAVSISCGEFHSGFINTQGHLYTMGGNSFGQLGVGSKKSSAVPLRVDLEGVVKVSCGSHSACVTNEGLFVWGSSAFGEHLRPKRVRLGGGKVKDVEVGGSFGVAVEGEKVFVWGGNENGELAQGDYKERQGAVGVTALEGKNVVMVAAGCQFCVCLGENGGGRKKKKTQSIALSAREIKAESQDVKRVLELLKEEKDRNKGMIEEVDELHRINVETKEGFQRKLQEANSQLQAVSDEAFKAKSIISDSLQQIQALKAENSRIKEENTKLRHLSDSSSQNLKTEVALSKLRDSHYLEIQSLQSQLEKEKVLKRQIERDLEVACAHRHRLESALSEIHNHLEEETTQKLSSLETKLKENSIEKRQLLNELDNLHTKLHSLQEDIEIMHNENKFYNENTKKLHQQAEKLQNHIKDLQNVNGLLIEENKQKDSILKFKDDELRDVRKMLQDAQIKNQEIILGKDKELVGRAVQFKDKTNQLLAKVPGLKNMPQIELIGEDPTDNRRLLADAQKSRIKCAVNKLIENNPESPKKNLCISPEGFGGISSRGGFTFRKSVTPSKEDVKAKIAALMQNRSQIERKLQLLQHGQETL